MALVEQSDAPRAEGGEATRFRLDTFLKAQRPRIYALAKAILKRHDLAEDATQETLLRVVQHAQQAEQKDDAGAWVLCIARNTAISMWRKHRRRDEVEFDSAAAEFDRVPQNCDASPLNAAIDREDFRRLVAMIERLPGPLREVLILKFYHGLEQRELARVLNVTAENARVRLWRAIRELRSMLDEN